MCNKKFIPEENCELFWIHLTPGQQSTVILRFNAFTISSDGVHHNLNYSEYCIQSANISGTITVSSYQLVYSQFFSDNVNVYIFDSDLGNNNHSFSLYWDTDWIPPIGGIVFYEIESFGGPIVNLF